MVILEIIGFAVLAALLAYGFKSYFFKGDSK